MSARTNTVGPSPFFITATMPWPSQCALGCLGGCLRGSLGQRRRTGLDAKDNNEPARRLQNQFLVKSAYGRGYVLSEYVASTRRSVSGKITNSSGLAADNCRRRASAVSMSFTDSTQ